MTAARHFEDFAEGDSFRSPSLTLTESAIVDFALTWDPQPFHIDAEYARERGNYGGLIASGLHTMAATLRLWLADGVFAACNIGSPGLDNVRFPRPVRPGDTLTVTTEILSLRASESKPDRGIARIRHTTRQQAGAVVMTMEATVFLRRRPSELTSV